MGKRKKVIAAATVLILVCMSAGQDLKTSPTPFRTAVKKNFAAVFSDELYSQFLPMVSQPYDGEGGEWLMQYPMEGILPLYGMARRELNVEESGREVQSAPLEGAILREDDEHSILLEYEELEQRGNRAQEGTAVDGSDLQALLREENEAAQSAASAFVPHGQIAQVDLEALRDYETLVRTFYTIDANTMAGNDQLNVDSLLGRDMKVKKTDGGPQILIYHTHSQEAFADSVPGDAGTSIVGVGERLAEILREEYGYQVLHHTGEYDVETRDDAYGKTLPALEQILEENPTIEVVIDLHRDQMAEDTRLVTDLDGRPTARFMLFNGLSRTKKTGDIAYLKNENIADNLAFSFQMKLKAEEYYPGLTRKIYLKGYRYNMHLRPKSLLVELGAQNNTVEEAMNACDPLAHILDLVLRGE